MLKIIKVGRNPKKVKHTKNSYKAVIEASSGFLLGGVKRSVSSGFELKSDAEAFLKQAVEVNENAGRNVGKHYIIPAYSVKPILHSEIFGKNPKISAKRQRSGARSRRKKKIACRKPKRKAKRTKKRKVIRARKNPPTRKRYETLIVGYDHGRGKHVKRYWFTGESFTRNRDEAKIYPGDAAKHEARRIVNRLPPAIYAIRVEKA